MKFKWADLSKLIHNLLWKKCCYQSMLSSNRLNSLTSIYEFVSRKSAQDILQGYLKLPFSSFSMQLPFFLEGGTQKYQSTHHCKWTNQFGIIWCTLTCFFAYEKCKTLTCSTTMPESLREEYTSCNMDDAPSNAEVEQ